MAPPFCPHAILDHDDGFRLAPVKQAPTDSGSVVLMEPHNGCGPHRTPALSLHVAAISSCKYFVLFVSAKLSECVCVCAPTQTL